MSSSKTSASDTIPVKVVVRVRPLIDLEINGGANECVTVDSNNNCIFVNDRSFCFDYVFGSHCSQDYVYEESVRNLLQSSLDGYNSTIFAYGQTGSGKTYTMGTDVKERGEEENRGILPRMVNDLFVQLSEMSVSDCTYEIFVSFSEIYNEKVYDLLSDHRNSLPLVMNGDSVFVRGLTEHQVNNADDVYNLVESGCINRSTGSTEMNKESSRSHAIFTITICKKCVDEITYRGKINFVDLAGSERLDKTKATGCRAQEGISINKSLSTLSKVIEALVKHQSHIPYRESSLTRLLKDSLGGSAHTVMIACVSPADSNCNETISTLRWADQARKIQNKPVLNVDPATAEILKLKQRIEELEEMVACSEKGESIENSSGYSKQQILLMQNEINRLSDELMKTKEELEASKKDLSFLLSQRQQNGLEALLKEKNEEIERLKEQNSPFVISDDDLEEEEKEEEEEETILSVNDEDKAKLDSLEEQETRINSLLQSKRQIQTLKQKYESKLHQITTKLDMLTKENSSLHQQLSEAEKKTASSRIIHDLQKKLKKNEAITQQLTKWKTEYNHIIDKYRLKEVEVRDLQNTLKQVKAERIRFQHDVAKKARARELEYRKHELEESKQRQKDKKEQKALENQIKKLEVKLSYEKEKAEKEKRQHEKEKTQMKEPKEQNREMISKQVLGIVYHEITEQTTSLLINESIQKRRQVQLSINNLQHGIIPNDYLNRIELDSCIDSQQKERLSQHLTSLIKQKSIQTSRINRLNRRLSAPAPINRWMNFKTHDQLHVVCDILLNELLKREEGSIQLKEQVKKSTQELRNEERKSAFLMSCLAFPLKYMKKSTSVNTSILDNPNEASILESSINSNKEKSISLSKEDESELNEFLHNQLELYQDEKQLLQLQLEEEKTMRDMNLVLPVSPTVDIQPSESNLIPMTTEKKQGIPSVKKSTNFVSKLKPTPFIPSKYKYTVPERKKTKSYDISANAKLNLVKTTSQQKRPTESVPSTPPHKKHKSISLLNYEEMEKSAGYLSFKKKKHSSAMNDIELEASGVSIDDLMLPKLDVQSIVKSKENDHSPIHVIIDTNNKTTSQNLQHEMKTVTSAEEEKEEYKRKQENEIDLLLSDSCGCHCKGKCSNRKCPCRNYGRRCSSHCHCNQDKCTNREQKQEQNEEETVIESSFEEKE